MTLVHLTLAAAVLGLIGDVLTTVIVIRQGGREMNPPMRWMMANIGMWPALLVTHIGFAVLLTVVGVWWINLFAAAAFAGVTIQNIGQIRGRP